jgi:hypothetical protein
LAKGTDVRITRLDTYNLPKRRESERLLGAVEGTPDGTHFKIPVHLRFSLSEALEPGSVIDVLIFDPRTGQYEPSGFVAVVEPSGRVASADVTHFTQFALAADSSAPRLSSINPSRAAVGSMVTLSGSGFLSTSDLNTVLFPSVTGGVLTVPALTSTPTTLTANVPDGAGSGKVYVKVGSVKSNAVRFRVITPVNQPPVVNPGPNEIINLPAGAVLSGTATDDGLPNGTLTTAWTMFSGPGPVTFGDPTSLSTPVRFAMPGTYILRLSANDGAMTSSADVTISVNPDSSVNLAPVVNAGPNQTIALPASASLRGTATDDGLPSGSTVAVSWTKVSGPGTVTFSNANTLSTAATFSTTGTYGLRLTASDSALSSSADVTITVNAAPVNQPPVVSAGPNQTITLPSNASLRGMATDDGLPSGSTVTVSWTKVSGAGTVTFSNANALSTTATFSTSGAYGLRLTASDSALSNSANVTITVNAAAVNQPPVVSAGSNQTITLPASASLTGTAADDGLPSGSTVAVSWGKVSGPGTVTFSNVNALSTTTSFSASGTYVLRLAASDSVLMATNDVTIIVNPAITPVVVPPPQAAGYTLTMNEEFNSLDVGVCWTGQTHNWYSSEFGAVIVPSLSQMSATNSILSLDWLTGQTPAESSLSSFDIGSKKGKAYRYGYYEARMKWSPVTGAWPAFWLLSLESAVTTGEWGEIDIFEGQGALPNHYFGTVHDWHAVNGVRTHTFNANNDYVFSSVDYSQFHTYGVLWEPGTITWYFDNQPLISAPAPAVMDSQDVEVILTSGEGVNWTYGNTTGVTSQDIKLNVDWVRVWQKNPSNVTLANGATASRGN